MCGISAVFGGSNITEIQLMTNSIAHRGPDDEGYVFFPKNSKSSPLIFGGKDTPISYYNTSLPYSPPNLLSTSQIGQPLIAAMGHRRLSIIDLEVTGHQPMCTSDQNIWISYNGEIYNYLELKEELIQLGYNFNSQGDSEVVLAAYHQWGKNCLDRFNGMFAFVIYNTSTKQIFAARDRFGIKPLYYWISPSGSLVFCSEIKQLTFLDGWTARLHHQSAYDFLNWSVTDHTEHTFFLNVHQLKGGQFLLFQNQSRFLKAPSSHTWYTLPASNEFKGSCNEAGFRFKQLLEDSIRLRLRADVPVGSCLSGGLDSSAIVCLANTFLKEKDALEFQKTFSACSHVKRFDERQYMEQVIQKTGVDAHFTYPDLDNLFPTIDKIIWHQDEPFSSTSIYAQWCVFDLAHKNNVKVMLDGQGADEQLAGYHCFFAPLFCDLLKRGQWRTLFHEIKACKNYHHITSPLRLMINHVAPELLRQPLKMLCNKPSAYTPWLNTNIIQPIKRDPFKETRHCSGSFVNRLTYAQTTRTNLPMLLHFEDRNSMAHSIEARTPFLDWRLAEFIATLPPEHKIHRGITKIALRNGLKGILPESIHTRIDKLGFSTPEEIWIKRDNPQLFIDELEKAIEKTAGILKPEALTFAKNIISGKSPFSFFIWRLICFGRWMDCFSVNI